MQVSVIVGKLLVTEPAVGNKRVWVEKLGGIVVDGILPDAYTSLETRC